MNETRSTAMSTTCIGCYTEFIGFGTSIVWTYLHTLDGVRRGPYCHECMERGIAVLHATTEEVSG